MPKYTKAELQYVIDKVNELCDTWEKNHVYLPLDPKKLPIAPVYQFRDIVRDYVTTNCACEKPKIGKRMDWAAPRCGTCGLFIRS